MRVPFNRVHWHLPYSLQRGYTKGSTMIIIWPGHKFA